MANGRGSLDCSYCRFFEGPAYPGGFGEERFCSFHGKRLPPSEKNRICCHFDPNEAYEEDQHGPWTTVARRFAWFRRDLEPGVLYEFCYNDPPGITRCAVLRVPDVEGGGWRPQPRTR